MTLNKSDNPFGNLGSYEPKIVICTVPADPADPAGTIVAPIKDFISYNVRPSAKNLREYITAIRREEAAARRKKAS